MAESDVERMRLAFEAGNASGWDVEALVPFVHPEGSFRNPAAFPGPPVVVGVEGLRELIGQWLSEFTDFQIRSDRIFGHEDQVVALVRAVGKSKVSGADLDWPLGVVFADFDGGQPREVRWFTDWDEALAAAGTPAS